MQLPSRVVRIDGGPSGRMYGIDGKPYASVTNITNALPKEHLIGWAAAREREMVVEAAWRLLAKIPVGNVVSREEFDKAMLAEVGEQRAHKKLLEKAGDIGTAIHGRVERDLRKLLGLPAKAESEANLSEEAKAAVATAYTHYKNWRVASGFVPTLIERMLYSKEFEFAGTMDVLGNLPGSGVCVGDWKSSSGIYLGALLQISAYRKAVLEMGLHDAATPLHGLIVRLPKTLDELEPEIRFVSADDLENIYFPAFLHVKAIWNAVHDYEDRYPYKPKKKKLAS